MANKLPFNQDSDLKGLTNLCILSKERKNKEITYGLLRNIEKATGNKIKKPCFSCKLQL